MYDFSTKTVLKKNKYISTMRTLRFIKKLLRSI